MLQDIVLGIVQGLTEFLPVSSSGHLVVVPAILGWEEPSLAFDLVLHLGTLLAVVFAYRRDLGFLARGVVGRGPDPAGARRTVLLLAVGTVPAAIAGLALGDFFESRFEDAASTVVELMISGVILLVADRIAVARATHPKRPVDLHRATGIGVAQAFAILPGISRSGATIATGIATDVTQTEAANFSFLLAIPAIAGAVATQVPDVTSGEFEITASVVAGFVAATVSGYLAIEYFLRFVRTRPLRVFAHYLFVFAAFSAVVLWIRD